MNKRGAGVVFCVIATVLIVTHYLITAIYLSNVQFWNKELFSEGLKYTRGCLDILSIVALIIGIVYLFVGERENKKR